MLTYININIILSCIIILFLVCSFTEQFQYEKLNLNLDNLDRYRRTPYTKDQYDHVSQIDPSYGYHMWQLQSAPNWNPNDIDRLSHHETPGSFGKLVSYLEDRNMAPSIKNLSV